MSRPRSKPGPSGPAGELSFLLSQVGAHSSGRFAALIEPLGFKPMHVGILRAIQFGDGLSQQALGERIGVFPSRLVSVLDELQARGLIERRNSPVDRRSYALHLTDPGREALDRIGRVSCEHQAAFCASLDDEERAQLAGLLRKIADEQGLTPDIHPGLRKLDGGECK